MITLLADSKLVTPPLTQHPVDYVHRPFVVVEVFLRNELQSCLDIKITLSLAAIYQTLPCG